jgi:hypothetical protein
VYPEVLTGHGPNGRFNDLIHAGGIGYRIVAWKIVQRGIESDVITATVAV